MRLLLCSGVMKRSGWTTLDALPDHGPDIRAKIPPLPASVMDHQWEAIEWIHGPSSLYRWETEEVLRQCHAALKPGGVLALEAPDALQCALDADFAGLFGDHSKRDPFLTNKYGWSPISLTKALQSVGFREVVKMPAQFHVPKRDFRLEARK